MASNIWFIQPSCHFSCLFVCLCLISFLQESGFFNPLFQLRVSGLVFLATTLWLLSYNPPKALTRSCLDLIDGLTETALCVNYLNVRHNFFTLALTRGRKCWGCLSLSAECAVVYCHWQPLRRALSSSPQGILSFWCFCSLLYQVDFSFFALPCF